MKTSITVMFSRNWKSEYNRLAEYSRITVGGNETYLGFSLNCIFDTCNKQIYFGTKNIMKLSRRVFVCFFYSSTAMFSTDQSDSYTVLSCTVIREVVFLLLLNVTFNFWNLYELFLGSCFKYNIFKKENFFYGNFSLTSD